MAENRACDGDCDGQRASLQTTLIYLQILPDPLWHIETVTSNRWGGRVPVKSAGINILNSATYVNF